MNGGDVQLAVGDLIDVAARNWRDAPCFVTPDPGAPDGRRTLSFVEASGRINRLARALESRGLTVGDRLAVLGVDSIEHIEVILACFKLGVVVVDLNYRLRAPEIEAILRLCPVDAIFHDSRYADIVDGVADVGAFAGWSRRLDAPDHDELVAGDDTTVMAARAHGEDLLTIAFTSGTTGIPKGVMQSERMLRNITFSGVREIRLRPGGLRYGGAPLFHISGLGSILYALASGCGSLVLDQFDAPTALWWLQHAEVTSCLLIPTMISSILDLPDVGASSYPHLRCIFYGGAPMPPALLRRVMDVFDCELFNGFGAGTEAGGQAMLGAEDHVAALNGREHLLGSIGKPIMGVDLRLCDDDLDDVAPGEIGEIVTRSNTVMSGYFAQPELTAQSIVDGWFRAGDMARMDDEGYLYLESRKADMIIRGGENVYPVEIESTLDEHPWVHDAVVVGVPDEHWGELVAAAITLHPDVEVPADELVPALQQWCRERLGSYKVPAHIVVFDVLPTTASGKFLKRTIRDDLLARLEAAR